MGYALIDNASLTAVQRLVGEVPIKGPDTINGDIVALENVVQAILFYDDLICVDNYKSGLRSSRIARFPFVRFVDPAQHDLSGIEATARREAELVRPEIRGGEFTDADFREFFRLLKMNIVCTWDVHASVYYLTMKMLGNADSDEYEKYSELSAAIFNELGDVSATKGRWSDSVVLVGSNGQTHEQRPAKPGRYGGTRRSLDVFVASLNWIAYKTIYYSLLSRTLQADTFLHPIRHGFQIHWMAKSGAYGHDFTSKLVASLSDDIRSTVAAVMDRGRNTAIALELPLFAAYLVRETGDVAKVLEAAVELKNRDDILQVRQLLKEIRLAFDEDGLASANKKIAMWEEQLQKASAFVKSKYGIQTPQGIPISPLISVYNSIAAITGLRSFPKIEWRVPVPEALKSPLTRSFGAFYKDIVRELTTTERLGGVRDLLARRFVYEDGWRDRYVAPKTEDPKFRNRASHWKEPM